ncbi:hypothetical protein ACS0TY_001480 [Phlomoides rotata]
MPSTRSIGELPPHLHCPLCKQVMKDAVLTSKCCFTSFCDKYMESRYPQAWVPSPTHSAASKGLHVPAPPPQQEETPKLVETVEEYKSPIESLNSDKGRVLKVPDVSEATHDSKTVKEAASQGSAPLADEEVQQKPISGEAGK